MAGQPIMGASAPARVASDVVRVDASRSTLHAAHSRTRRLHAVFAFGDLAATVHSTRRDGDAEGALLALTDGAQTSAVRMQPPQARALARALLDAAEAAEARLRHGRGSSASAAPVPDCAMAAQGGAA